MKTAMDWRMQGACRDVDPDLHFPDGEGRAFQPQIAKAKQVCFGCPVLTDCLNVGMEQPFGIWGGLTEGERRQMRARKIRRLQLDERERYTWHGVRFPKTRPAHKDTEAPRRLLAECLAALQRNGASEVSARDLPDLFFERVRSRTWAKDELRKLARTGELEHTGETGRFRFPAARSEVAA